MMSDKTGLRVLVCGGRDFHDHQRVWDTLDRIEAERGRIAVVIHGNASGADRHAWTWGIARKREVLGFPAHWQDISHPDAVIVTRGDDTKYDAKAGLRRNQRMLDEGRPDLVIGFPGGTGTADMLTKARRAGVEVIQSVAQSQRARRHRGKANITEGY